MSPRHDTVDPILLPSGNPNKCHEEVSSLQPMFPTTKHFDFFSLSGGSSEGLDFSLNTTHTGDNCQLTELIVLTFFIYFFSKRTVADDMIHYMDGIIVSRNAIWRVGKSVKMFVFSNYCERSELLIWAEPRLWQPVTFFKEKSEHI